VCSELGTGTLTTHAVLPHDAYGRDRGLFISGRLPWVLGSSLAGIVHQLGPEPSPSFTVGDRIFGMSNLATPMPDQSGLQEYAILQTDSVTLTPKSITDDEAATLPINIATTAITLFTSFGFDFPAPWEDRPFEKASEPIVLLGAGTNVARLFTRLATQVLGIKTIIAVASLSNEAELLEAGASYIIDRHLPEATLIAQVHAAAGGASNVTRIFDCASWEHHLATALLAPDKPTRLATLHRVNEAKIHEDKPLCRTTLVQNTNANLGAYARPFWQTLPRWIEAGIVRPTAFWTLDGLENVDAIDKQLDDYSAGKGLVQLVVRP
jgi:NADPH2:quinone reductase